MAWEIFANMFGRSPNTLGVNNASNSLLNLPEGAQLGLLDCENIYTYWGLGKRIIHALGRFAFSTPREITISEAPTEAVDEFKRIAEEVLQQDRIIGRVSSYCRIYGMSGLFVAIESDGYKEEDNLTKKQCRESKIKFNALNPLNLSGTVFNQDALSIRFQRPEVILVAGKKVGTKRATVIQNNEPIYLRFSVPTFAFSGLSVFQNMVPLIKAWRRSIISLERMGTKASSVVFKEGSRGKASAIQAQAATRSAEMLQQMENDGVAVIDKDADVTFFPLTGVSEVDAILKGLEREILMALDDTPSAILLDKDLSSGLSEGTEEIKAVIMAVENFRKDILTPLYHFTDPYVMAVAWTDDFINTVRANNMDKYAGFTIAEIRQMWEDSFTFKFGNLYPEPEQKIQTTNGVILDNLRKAKDMGMDTADIEEEINERKMFKNDVTLSAGNIITEEGTEESPGKIPYEGVEADEKD